MYVNEKQTRAVVFVYRMLYTRHMPNKIIKPSCARVA